MSPKYLQEHHTYIIAEAGVNHNGSLERAMQLIDAAAEAGADAVKFQKFYAESLVSANAKKADYQIKNTGKNDSQLAMIKALELDIEAHRKLQTYAMGLGIDFLSSPFDSRSLEELMELGMPLLKVPSGELINVPFLREMATTGLPIILSTGMATMADIEAGLEILLQAGLHRRDICILHCNTEYPTPMADVNLRAMGTIGQAFGTRIGYSDHTLGIEVPIAAVALGATVIEKHFTLDKSLEGPDHAASLDPTELKAMVQAIRNIDIALGSAIKTPSPSEAKNAPIARKSIVAATTISMGEVLSADKLTSKRPGTGISPLFWDKIVGRVASRDYQAEEQIEW